MAPLSYLASLMSFADLLWMAPLFFHALDDINLFYVSRLVFSQFCILCLVVSEEYNIIWLTDFQAIND